VFGRDFACLKSGKGLKMAKGLYAKMRGWLRPRSETKFTDYSESLDEQGLISPEPVDEGGQEQPKQQQTNEVLVKKVQPVDKSVSLEKLQGAFNKLVDQLQGINENLAQQVAQQKELTNRIDLLPRLLESFPAMVANQKQVVDELVERLKGSALKNEQFLEAVEKIPREAEKQTNTLLTITDHLSAAAESDAAMTQGFNRFHQTLDKLSKNTEGQKDSILQMKKTFSASDRYLKYLVSKQNKRFVWVFWTAIGVCVFAIFALVVAVAVILQQ
jgi:methyl-accepting chemotaxis protein